MSKSIIKIGEFKKILLLPFLLALTQIITIVFDDIIHEKVKNHALESTSVGLGQILIIIIPHIKLFSISNKKERTKCECSKKNCIHYTIVLILYAIAINFTYFNNDNNSYSIFWNKTENLSTLQGLEIITITVISIFLLKYKYFIYHYLSIILFCLSSVGFDLILNNYKKIISNMKILLSFGGFLAEGAYFCYVKYMIDKHYHQYWNILFFIGIMVLFFDIITIIEILILKDGKGILSYIDDFMQYFKDVSIEIIIIKFILNIILQFISNILEILTIFYLTPEYILIAQNLSKIYLIIYMFIYNKNYEFEKYQYCYLIFYVLQIFSLMIYLEIIELNFCKLNKNTRRNIKLRINDDLIERIDSFINNDSFEQDGGYIVRNTDNNFSIEDNIKIELNQIIDNQNSSENI